MNCWLVLLQVVMIWLLREEGIPNIPEGYEEYVRIYLEVVFTLTCGLDGVVELCSTLHQQGCSLMEPHGHFLVVLAFPEEFSHNSSNSLRRIFVIFWVVNFIKTSWLIRCEELISAQFRFLIPPSSSKALQGVAQTWKRQMFVPICKVKYKLKLLVEGK